MHFTWRDAHENTNNLWGHKNLASMKALTFKDAWYDLNVTQVQHFTWRDAQENTNNSWGY